MLTASTACIHAPLLGHNPNAADGIVRPSIGPNAGHSMGTQSINFAAIDYYYYYCYDMPIQATVGLGASKQRFYDSLPIRPILALFPILRPSILTLNTED